ncbi:hypothetical protein [Mucilaginibacter glaciei]|uniref:Uncharacterized protein n=1 Tax=Mucilaginibacter glaciei TaxID=2772109 RepID=A0A926NV23_9SPHI|nr:hypothetical protein [Mucilaginibacter glaciei]MBD1395107.1 hypothetical protein [Mucilaginibacter glaciei]
MAGRLLLRGPGIWRRNTAKQMDEHDGSAWVNAAGMAAASFGRRYSGSARPLQQLKE